jgi:DNA ligase-1
MPDLQDGETTTMQGSGKSPYILKNTGGVYSCSCPAWRNQSVGIEKRTCKHLRKLRGDAAETERVGSALPARKPVSEEGEEEGKGPPLLLAHVWENDVDLAGWWMSEKLDGVRAYWDGKLLISRLGNELHAPDWFVKGLPKSPLDGELWLERKAFQKTVSIVRRQDKSDHWKQIRYVVFDAPALKEPFEQRLKFVAETLAAAKSEFVLPHEQLRCKSVDHLRKELARVEALGGEGLMLRQPGSNYEAGRSTTLLKVKTFHDADGVVVAHAPGKGRHKGRVGALVVQMSDGTEFSVGTGLSDKERESPPAIGSTITFRYQELSTGGVPRFPSFVRSRKDAKK